METGLTGHQALELIFSPGGLNETNFYHNVTDLISSP